MLYCYFIARSDPEVERLSFRTLSAAGVDFVREQDLVAATRRVPPGTRSTPELMLEYNAVLTAASKRATVLPLRFGSSFRSETTVARLLADRRPELLHALDRLEGKAEMSVRVRLKSEDSANARVAEINETCRPLDSWFEVQENPAGGSILEMAHLIERRSAEEYRQRLEPQAVEVSGPRPPFHFLPQFLRMPVRAERSARRSEASSRAG
ncbi:MAG: GvpL/GvpF family gas vesicle protein [Acidobacteria bacterium]|nr:GvpL/GvpF family gas vesicle protein [Acidobacteriota bacterium]